MLEVELAVVVLQSKRLLSVVMNVTVGELSRNDLHVYVIVPNVHVFC